MPCFSKSEKRLRGGAARSGPLKDTSSRLVRRRWPSGRIGKTRRSEERRQGGHRSFGFSIGQTALASWWGVYRGIQRLLVDLKVRRSFANRLANFPRRTASATEPGVKSTFGGSSGGKSLRVLLEQF